ncbi:MAG: hypothetical protein AB7I19_07730 [Planctomycetota bacterium]
MWLLRGISIKVTLIDEKGAAVSRARVRYWDAERLQGIAESNEVGVADLGTLHAIDSLTLVVTEPGYRPAHAVVDLQAIDDGPVDHRLVMMRSSESLQVAVLDLDGDPLVGANLGVLQVEFSPQPLKIGMTSAEGTIDVDAEWCLAPGAIWFVDGAAYPVRLSREAVLAARSSTGRVELRVPRRLRGSLQFDPAPSQPISIHIRSASSSGDSVLQQSHRVEEGVSYFDLDLPQDREQRLTILPEGNAGVAEERVLALFSMSVDRVGWRRSVALGSFASTRRIRLLSPASPMAEVARLTGQKEVALWQAASPSIGAADAALDLSIARQSLVVTFRSGDRIRLSVPAGTTAEDVILPSLPDATVAIDALVQSDTGTPRINCELRIGRICRGLLPLGKAGWTYSEAPLRSLQAAIPDARGHVRVSLPHGRYLIQVLPMGDPLAGGLPLLEQEILVPAASSRFDLIVPRSRRVELNLRDADSRPLDGLWRVELGNRPLGQFSGSRISLNLPPTALSLRVSGMFHGLHGELHIDAGVANLEADVLLTP